MPEGHTVYRHARELRRRFAGQPMSATSPQGRFAAGAARLHGARVLRVQAHGKHLFLEADNRCWLHVHLGLAGVWTFGDGDPPPATGAVRLRLCGGGGWADLRGPVICEVITAAERAAIANRLGPDPLRRGADPEPAAARIRASAVPIGQLLMRQEVICGVGNVYRAEALFRAGLDPWLPGRELGEPAWTALWADLSLLLRDGVRRGWIVTTEPVHRSRRGGPVAPQDAHYVYRRAGLPCRVCATAVLAEPMAGRTLYRCPECQRPS